MPEGVEGTGYWSTIWDESQMMDVPIWIEYTVWNPAPQPAPTPVVGPAPSPAPAPEPPPVIAPTPAPIIPLYPDPYAPWTPAEIAAGGRMVMEQETGAEWWQPVPRDLVPAPAPTPIPVPIPTPAPILDVGPLLVITAPDTANVNSSVDYFVRIANKFSVERTFQVNVSVQKGSGYGVPDISKMDKIAGGQSLSYSSSFNMPNSNAYIFAEILYLDDTYAWVSYATYTWTVAPGVVVTGPAEFQYLSCTYSKV